MKKNKTLLIGMCLALALLYTLPGMALTPLHIGVDVSSSVSDTRVINKSFDVNADALVALNARESEVLITTWSQNRVEVKVTLTVEAYDKEDMEKMFDEMKVLIEGNKEGVSIQSKLEVKSVIQTGTRQRIKTKNNGTIRVKNYSFSYEVKMPATNHLNLKNRFGNVQLGAHKGNLDLELYECSLNALQINAQKAVGNLRFSKGDLGNMKSLNLSMYESKLKAGNVGDLILNTKFSKLHAGDIGTLNLTGYESKLTLVNVQNLAGTHSFGSLTAASVNNMTLTTYELKLDIGNVEKMMLQDSKFSKFNVGTIGNLQGRNLYENTMVIGTLESAQVDSKFTKFEIGTLTSSLESAGYETDILVGTVKKEFSVLKISGKFCKNTLNLGSGSGFKLVADVQFGDVKYPEAKVERQSYTKRSNGFSMTGRSTGYTGSALIDFSGYENSLSLNF
jgi:hypothetical protein